MSAEIVIEGIRLREVLAHRPAGVTVITANTREGPTGLAANSFTSVSLDPPLTLGDRCRPVGYRVGPRHRARSGARPSVRSRSK